jgi:hypothetical protein
MSKLDQRFSLKGGTAQQWYKAVLLGSDSTVLILILKTQIDHSWEFKSCLKHQFGGSCWRSEELS